MKLHGFDSRQQKSPRDLYTSAILIFLERPPSKHHYANQWVVINLCDIDRPVTSSPLWFKNPENTAMSRLRRGAKLQLMPRHQWHFVQPRQHHHLRGERWEQKFPGHLRNISQLKPSISKEGAKSFTCCFHLWFCNLGQ